MKRDMGFSVTAVAAAIATICFSRIEPIMSIGFAQGDELTQVVFQYKAL
jgi:hypothetical protein